MRRRFIRWATVFCAGMGLISFSAWDAVGFGADVQDPMNGGGKGKANGVGGQKGAGKGGQKGGKGKDKENLLPLSGTVQQAAAQALVVESDDGARYLVGIDHEAQITHEGEASEEFLKSGTVVEFDVEFDRGGNLVHEIRAVTFVEASALNPVGLFPRAVQGLAGSANEQGQSSFLARGRVASVRNGSMVVQTGNRPLMVKLADDVSYAARFDRWTLAAIGDTVSGEVELLPQPNVGLKRVVARRVTVQAAAMIEPPGKRRPAKSKAASDARTAEDADRKPNSN